MSVIIKVTERRRLWSSNQIFKIMNCIWKARNSFCFEYKRLDSANILVLDKAIVEAEIWRELQAPRSEDPSSTGSSSRHTRWVKPRDGWIKCNVAASWVNNSVNCGGVWILRNEDGKTLLHFFWKWTEFFFVMVYNYIYRIHFHIRKPYRD